MSWFYYFHKRIPSDFFFLKMLNIFLKFVFSQYFTFISVATNQQSSIEFAANVAGITGPQQNNTQIVSHDNLKSGQSSQVVSSQHHYPSPFSQVPYHMTYFILWCRLWRRLYTRLRKNTFLDVVLEFFPRFPSRRGLIHVRFVTNASHGQTNANDTSVSIPIRDHSVRLYFL